MESRLPAHLEAAGIRRIAESQGGFGTVVAKGERDAGTIAVIISCRDHPAELFERMPQIDGNRIFVPSLTQDPDNPKEFFEVIERRCARDADLWVLEVQVPNRERFVAALPH